MLPAFFVFFFIYNLDSETDIFHKFAGLYRNDKQKEEQGRSIL